MSKILIADDSKLMRMKLYKVLTSAGHHVVETNDGVQALQAAQEQTGISLFIVDINMPNLDGISLIKKLRNLSEYQETPIFVLSTEASEHMKGEGTEIGATAWIVKPLNEEALLAAVQSLIE